jgi:hypothetical protein
MRVVDDTIETIHLYVVREEEKRPYTVFPLFCALLCVVSIVAMTAYSAQHPSYEHATLTVPAQFLPLQTFKTSQAIVATGIQTYAATTAQGTLTITNGSVETVQLPSGMIFTGKDGIEAVTDSAAYVPAGSADGFGASTVSAHLLTPGINISALDIDQVVGTSLYVRNLYPFTGGKPAYSVKIVTPHDKQLTLRAAKVSVRVQAARIPAILAEPCRESVSWGAFVQLSWTCQFVAYPRLPGMQITATRLSGKNLFVDVTFVTPPKRIVAR